MSRQSGRSAQLVHKLEPVHLRHHQVENDHVGPCGGERVDRNLTVLRLSHLPADRLQRLAYAAADHVVIVDQKDASRGRAADAGQRLHELGAVDGLYQIVRRTQRVTAVLLFDDRHQNHRNACQRRIALDGGKHRPAIEIGHHDVERHRRRPQFPHQPKPFLAAARRDHRKAGPFQMPHHELAHGRIVVHHQDQRLFRLLERMTDRAGSACSPCSDLHDPRQPDGEGRALARLAFHRDVATHHAAKMPADGETKPGTAVFARGRGRGLRKLLKQLAHLLFGHADSGVGQPRS